MKTIRCVEYVTGVDKRLEKYHIYINCYTHKYNFMKPSISNPHLFTLFKRYMHNDIFIKWGWDKI